MYELYFGLVPGEEPVDRLVDGIIPDPAVIDAVRAEADLADADLIVGDPLTGAIIGRVPRSRPTRVARRDAVGLVHQGLSLRATVVIAAVAVLLALLAEGFHA
jgi:hypothetical protein